MQRNSNNQRQMVVYDDVGAAQHPPTGLLAQFGSHIPSIIGLSYAPRRFETGGEVIMLVPRTPAAASSIIHTSVVECNKTDSTPHQCAAFYLSALSGIFPALLPLAKEDLRDMGYSVKEVTEDTVSDYAITLQSWIDGSTLFAIFGQLALYIIYKNMNISDFTRLLDSKLYPIGRLAGKVGNFFPGNLYVGRGDALFSRNTPSNIQTIVGSGSRIPPALLNTILANRVGESRLNSVCNYLADFQDLQT